MRGVMTSETKKTIRYVLSTLVVANTVIFLAMAYFHLLPDDPKAALFIDFWGRFTVYSLWFIGYALYRMYLPGPSALRSLIIFLVCFNIPLFLGLAYYDKVSNNPETLVFVDFWGRITVYSLWFMCYEYYRTHFQDDNLAARLG